MSKPTIASTYQLFKGEFLVPNYYKDFACKNGLCRNTCCGGWRITIPQKEYYLIHGLDCSKTLRKKIDSTFKPLLVPNLGSYAEIRFNEKGKCPLLEENGYCGMHQELGINNLSSVCHYYPRGFRTDYRNEASMSNSCEKTIELLFDNLDPISFEKKEVMFRLPLAPKRINEVQRKDYSLVRDKVFELLVCRDLSLPNRLLKIGVYLLNDESMNIELQPMNEEQFIKLQMTIFNISNWILTNTKSLAEYFVEMNQNDQFETFDDFEKKRERFHKLLQYQEIYFEKILTNNLFYNQFPFQDHYKTVEDAFFGLVTKYIMIHYLAIHLMSRRENITDFVDLLSKIFRVYAHTNFERNVMLLFKEEGYTSIFDFNFCLSI